MQGCGTHREGQKMICLGRRCGGPYVFKTRRIKTEACVKDEKRDLLAKKTEPRVGILVTEEAKKYQHGMRGLGQGTGKIIIELWGGEE